MAIRAPDGANKDGRVEQLISAPNTQIKKGLFRHEELQRHLVVDPFDSFESSFSSFNYYFLYCSALSNVCPIWYRKTTCTITSPMDIFVVLLLCISEFESGPVVVKMVLNTQRYLYLSTMWFHAKKFKETLKKSKLPILLYKSVP